MDDIRDRIAEIIKIEDELLDKRKEEAKQPELWNESAQGLRREIS